MKQPKIVPTQTVDKDSEMFRFLMMINEWDKITGKSKETKYFFLIFSILNYLGEDHNSYEFFTPFKDEKLNGFNFENLPEMTKEYYQASFNTIVYVLNKTKSNNKVSMNVLIYGVIAQLTIDFRTKINSRERMVTRLKGVNKRYHVNPDGVDYLLEKMQSEKYIFHIRNELEVWEKLKQKYFNIAF